MTQPNTNFVSYQVSVFLAKSESGAKWAGLRPAEPPKNVPKMDENSADPSAGLMSMMKQGRHSTALKLSAFFGTFSG